MTIPDTNRTIANAALALTILAGAANAQCPIQESHKLVDPDGDSPFDRFGRAVGIAGDYLVIGEQGQNRIHFWRWTNNDWVREDTRDGVLDQVEFFGTDIALDGETDRLLVGAGVDSAFCGDPNDCATGAAVLYQRAQGQWEMVEKFQRPFYLDAFNQFGHTVALNEDTLMIAASESVNGVVVPWERQHDEWTRLDPLEADDGQEGDSFGRAIALALSRSVIGAPGDDNGAPQAGSAYVFDRVGGVWQQSARLSASTPVASSFFGSSAAIAGDTIAIGAPGPFATSAGTVFMFQFLNGAWTHVQSLTPSGGLPGDAFGTRLAAPDADTLIVSALRDGHAGSSSGAAYVYQRVNGQWTETSKLTSSDAGPDQAFGISVAADTNRTAIGAYEAFSGGGGAVYIFEGPDQCPCAADFNNDGTINSLDVLDFLNAWAAGAAEADFNGDGTVNTLDVLGFLNAWSSGC